MAYSTILKPSDYFNTKLWNGNSSTQAITGVGFQPDFVWGKQRTGTESHQLLDVLRGANNILTSNTDAAALADSNILNSFDSDGYTLGNQNQLNDTGYTYVGWNWKAGTTSGITTNGSTNITPSGYSFNATSKFSVIKWSGSGVDGAYLPHGLGVAPSVAIIKKTSASEEWVVYHIGLQSNQAYLRLNNTAAKVTSSGIWYSYTPDATNIRLSNDTWVNASGSDYVGYFFSNTSGYQKHGLYNGNGNATKPAFIYTGFKPAFVMLKVTSVADSWNMYDNRRLGYNGTGSRLKADSNVAEDTGSAYQTCNFYSNGFSPQGNDLTSNQSGTPYIYMAFAETPFVANSGDSVPTTAR